MSDTQRADVFAYPYVIFDFDGTLLDSMDRWVDSFVNEMRRRGYDADAAREHYEANRASRVRPLLEAFLKPHGVTVDATLYKDVVDRMSKEVERLEISFFNGALQLLEDLKASNRRVFISSFSKCENVLEHIKRQRIHHCIDLALGSTRIEKGPAHIDRFAQSVRTDVKTFCNNAVIIGDTPQDMLMAKKAGIDAIGVLGTLRRDQKQLLLDAGAKHVVPGIQWLLKRP